jgi:hypothetical protein
MSLGSAQANRTVIYPRHTAVALQINKSNSVIHNNHDAAAAEADIAASTAVVNENDATSGL